MVDLVVRAKCPSCGTPLSSEGGSEGLCPGCLLELALDDTALEAELEPGEAPTLQFTPGGAFAEGEIQGERYRIRSLLGRGGMGEVWRAYDLKLRLDVALKALRSELIQNQEALETLRQEVRVAREVVSPNVCRVFDLEELDGQELISMEYVDGTTLQEILKERGPLELNEAREIVSQFLAGLEAIHAAGLVHRDIKPENLMLTRTGRVVVMDFGIAKGLGDGRSGMIAGTPAYMSPEQSRGGELDARSDVFSAGVVLAEMVEPGGIRSFDDRRRLWEGIHQASPRVTETPWAKVITQAVAAEREERYATAAALARALEEVTLRAAGDETARPYPGLSAFQQEDAEYFFGRELEVEALWKKLRRPHLLAVIGPSGAGKSSFLQAGLLPTLPEGWRALVVTPGNRPFDNLARALAPELADALGAANLLLRFQDPGIAVELLAEWRGAHEHTLLIVDQFEELFTQNPKPVQERFADLLGQLPLAADVHVVLSMRDDFLLHCQSLEPLAPVFSEMTPLGPPTGASLRRAIVQPALKCGYRFEDESIVEDMLAEVEGRRGALPIVAFSAAQLWERRDREQGLLSREAYEAIGGVGGALAQHAEATLDQIGKDGTPIVRELFRNLVTAQGTRAARDRDELLSVFGDADAAAEQVLDTLIDARLLTSYEVAAVEDEGAAHHRIEIVHESLLSNWPRLVRWQMQDAEGAKLRDELRAQAQLWQQHARSPDYLWAGTAFKEYELWRERYPGGLTTSEEEFARAMTAHAERRTRRRRLAVAAAFVALVAVLAIVGTFWRQSEAAKRGAVAEARRAESAKLFALAQLEQEGNRTGALAYAIASLELADLAEVRRFALETLWRGPMAIALPELETQWVAFSPDGHWLAQATMTNGGRLVSEQGGQPVVELRTAGEEVMGSQAGFGPDSSFAYTTEQNAQASIPGRLRLWSVPDGEPLQTIESAGALPWHVAFSEDGRRILLGSKESTFDPRFVIETWLLDPEPVRLGQWSGAAAHFDFGSVDSEARFLLYGKGRDLHLVSVQDPTRGVVRQVGDHDHLITSTAFSPSGEVLASADDAGEIRLWQNSEGQQKPLRRLHGEHKTLSLRFGPQGSWLMSGYESGSVRLFDLVGPPDADPLRLDYSAGAVYSASFHPREPWVVTGHSDQPQLWSLHHRYPRVLRGHHGSVGSVAFSPDGRWLASASVDGTLRVWPLSFAAGPEGRVVFAAAEKPFMQGLAFDPDGRFLLSSHWGKAVVVPLDGSTPRTQSLAGHYVTLALDQRGRLAAVGGGEMTQSEDRLIRIWDLETDDVRELDAGDGQWIRSLAFTVDGDLRATTEDRTLRRWDLATATYEVELENVGYFTQSVDGQLLLAYFQGGVTLHDLANEATWDLVAHGDELSEMAFDPTASIVVTGSFGGAVRVGPVTGEEPQLLLGHEGAVTALAISPDGQWIASGGKDGTIRLWPMPDLSQPPLHLLPDHELLTRLRSQTNLRVVPDDESVTGYKLKAGPFPGWQEVPTW